MTAKEESGATLAARWRMERNRNYLYSPNGACMHDAWRMKKIAIWRLANMATCEERCNLTNFGRNGRVMRV